MGINQRIVSTSVVLSFCICTVLLLLFSQVGSDKDHAEAATRPVDGPPRQESAPHRDRARSSLDQRIQAIADNLLTPSGHLNLRAVRALRAQGSCVVPVLLSRLTGEEAPMQEAILAVLADFGEAQVTERLLDVLEGQISPRMAIKIGAAIRTQGASRFCSRLEEMTVAEQPAVRLGAAVALRTCPSRPSAAALVQLLKTDDEEDIRVHALTSLKAAHGAFLEQALHISLSDASPRVRLEAIRAVEEHRLVGFAGELRGMLKYDPDPSVKRVARRTLAVLE